MIRACSFHKIAEKLIFSITQSIIFPFHYDIPISYTFCPSLPLKWSREFTFQPVMSRINACNLLASYRGKRCLRPMYRNTSAYCTAVTHFTDNTQKYFQQKSNHFYINPRSEAYNVGRVDVDNGKLLNLLTQNVHDTRCTRQVAM